MPLNTDILKWKRPVLLFILAALIWYWYSGMMLHHVWDSPFQYKGADPAYWLLEYSGLPMLLLATQTGALLFSTVLILSFLMALLFIQQRWICVLAGALLLLYQVLFNYKIGYHTHHLFGLQFALLPFYFSQNLFPLSTAFARLLVCLTYFFAGFFKLSGKAWSQMDSFSNTLQNQHAAYFYFEPETLRSKLALWLSAHETLSWLLFFSAMLLQLVFVLGFFSRRFDRMLAVFMLLFHLMDWFLMNLGVFMGMLVMAWLFLVTPVSAGQENSP